MNPLKRIREQTRRKILGAKKGCICFYKGEPYFILNKKITSHQGTHLLSFLHKIGRI